MTKQGLKLEVEKLAKQEGLTFVEACQAMQAAAAKMGSEDIISIIHQLKMESLGL